MRLQSAQATKSIHPSTTPRRLPKPSRLIILIATPALPNPSAQVKVPRTKNNKSHSAPTLPFPSPTPSSSKHCHTCRTQASRAASCCRRSSRARAVAPERGRVRAAALRAPVRRGRDFDPGAGRAATTGHTRRYEQRATARTGSASCSTPTPAT